MPARHPLGAELDHVGHQPHRRVDREAPLLLRDVLLQDVGLDRARQPLRRRSPWLLRRDDVERQHHRRRRVDRHRRRHLAQSDAAEQRLHVVERVDRHALAADLAQRARVVRVVAHQRRHVERRRESRLAVVEQVAEALVRLLRGAEAGELAHRPEPPAIHRRVDAARERDTRRGSRSPRRAQVVLGVERLHRLAGQGREQRVALRRALEALAKPALGVRHGMRLDAIGHSLSAA